MKNARATFNAKEYQHTLAVLKLIDPNLLSDENKRMRDEMINTCRVELGRSGMADLLATGGVQPPDKESPGTPTAVHPPGTAHVSPDHPTSAADSLRSLAFQKLRSQGLKIRSDAEAAFGRGETDLAMQMLIEYENQVRASGLDRGSIARLLRPIGMRLDTFRLMKGQTDAIAQQNQERRDAREIITNRGIAEEERKREVANLVRQYHTLVKKSDFAGAEQVALQAKQLDPDDAAIGALYDMAKMSRRVRSAEKDKSDKENFFLEGLNANDRLGPLVTMDDPVKVKLQRV